MCRPRPGGAVAHEPARVERRAQQAREVKSERDRARAVVAMSRSSGRARRRTCTACARSGWPTRSRARPRRASASATAAAVATTLEPAGRGRFRARGASSGRPHRRPPAHARDWKRLTAASVLRSEHAVGRDPECPLQRAHSAASVGALAAAGRRVRDPAPCFRLSTGPAPRPSAWRVCGPTIPSTVEPVLALVALDGPLGLRAEDAVGGDAQGVLERAHVVLRLRGPRARAAPASVVADRAERGEQRHQGEHEQCSLSG